MHYTSQCVTFLGRSLFVKTLIFYVFVRGEVRFSVWFISPFSVKILHFVAFSGAFNAFWVVFTHM